MPDERTARAEIHATYGQVHPPVQWQQRFDNKAALAGSFPGLRMIS